MTRIMILAATALPLILATPPVAAQCSMSYCDKMTATPSRSYITNQHRQIIGDLYDPGHGRRVQIRDTDRRILFYTERDGTVTDTRRQRIGSIDDVR